MRYSGKDNLKLFASYALHLCLNEYRIHYHPIGKHQACV